MATVWAKTNVWRWLSFGAFATSAVICWYVGLQHRFTGVRWIPHFGIFALVGLVAGIVGLVQARAERQPVALSVVGFLLNALLCLFSLLSLVLGYVG